MHKFLYLVSICFLISSCYKDRSFYDLNCAGFNFYTVIGKNVCFQFNEPLKKLIVFFDDGRSIVIDNKFPKANFFINCDLFREKAGRIRFATTDTSDNKSDIEINASLINTNPALIEISDIRFKYSKKKNQNITLRALSNGSLIGFCLVIFFRNQKIVLPIKDENVSTNDKLIININKDEKSSSNKEIEFKNKSVSLFFKNRLGQSNGLIYIMDNNNKILDFILYYDSKKCDLTKLKLRNPFKRYISEIEKNSGSIVITDIKGNTLKKSVIKRGKNFVIKRL